MNKFSESVWGSFSLRQYLGEIKRRHGIVDTLALPNMRDLPPVRIENLFVQPLLSDAAITTPFDDSLLGTSGKSLLALFHEERRIVVLGDPGSGKTTLANWLAWRLSSGLNAPLPSSLDGALPIPCVLREIPTRVFIELTNVKVLALYIADRLLGDRLGNDAREAIVNLVEKGKYVLILDGVDEIPLKYREHVARWVRETSNKEASLLATSRVVGYDDFPIHSLSSQFFISRWGRVADPKLTLDYESFDLPKGIFENLGRDAKFKISESIYLKPAWLESAEIPAEVSRDWAKVHYLLPFDESRIAAFIENWYLQRCNSEVEAKQRKDDLLLALGQSNVTRELAKTPNLLSLMAIVHRERAHLPDGKALLYKEIANAYINTIDQHRKISVGDALAPYGLEAKEGWIAYVGFRMQVERASAASNGGHDGVLVAEEKVLTWLKEAMSLSGVDQPSTVAADFLWWVARRCGLLLPRGDQRFAFVHLSFQEYFCARYLASQVVSPAFVRKRIAVDSAVSEKNLKKWAGSPLWQESLIYLFELISGERGPDWVDEIASIIFDNMGDYPPELTSLAAKTLTDRHIQLRSGRKREMALKSLWKAVEELKNLELDVDLATLRAFLLAGFASGYVQQNDSIRGLQLLSRSDFSDVRKPEDQLLLFGKGDDIVEISALEKMERLRAINLSGTNIKDISPLGSLGDLEYLDINSTSVLNADPLVSLSKLRELDISYTRIHNFAFLKGLKSLKILNVSNAGLRTLPKIPPLKNLRWVRLEHNKINDISPLLALENLNVLFLNGTDVADLTPLSKSANLTVLTADSTPVKTLPKFTNNLRWLSIDNTSIRSIRTLQRMEKLEVLTASKTKISDISPLASCAALVRLDLSNTSVSDISALCTLNNLQFLDLSYTNIEDVSSLVHLSSLREVRLVGTAIKNCSDDFSKICVF